MLSAKSDPAVPALERLLAPGLRLDTLGDHGFLVVATVRAPFLESLLGEPPRPASAFLVEGVPYRWKRGVREPAA